jgi:gliding motility-associated-like protein
MPSAATGLTFAAGNYSITYLPGDLVVGKADLTVTADNKTRVFGYPNPSLTVSYSGFVNNDDAGKLTKLPVIATTATLSSPVGQYQITASGAESDNYNFAYLPGVLTVIAAPPTLAIPNAFTPNGDGINETWNIKNIGFYTNCSVKIFNRYGINVFTSNGYAVPWDGTYKGAALPSGTYYYIINLKNDIPLIAGYVVILR